MHGACKSQDERWANRASHVFAFSLGSRILLEPKDPILFLFTPELPLPRDWISLRN